ncbi:MAG: hypothetical protein KJ985_05750, partial [Proteobacteria bacterium]|nr:hypothetical protein [Pseudomonadota bacterium]
VIPFQLQSMSHHLRASVFRSQNQLHRQYCVGPSYDQPPFTLDLKGEWSGLGEVSKPSNTDDVTGSASETQMPEDDGSSIVAGKE